ncbi:MAG: hypothetical protein HYX94_05460 [Chloroflexi bacterium]|nr:hypothetical protein [Chloroflexota bacterium]
MTNDRKARTMFRKIAGEEKGVVAVIVAFILVVLLGFAALVVDAGVLFETRRELQNAMDGAALAAAQQIPFDVSQTQEMAYVYAEKNGVSRAEVTQNSILSVYNTNDAVRVKARRSVNLFFAPVLGINAQYVDAQATALLTKILPTDIWPWGVTQESIQPGSLTLKLGSRNSQIGNFMALDFPSSSGGDAYRDYIKYGYNQPPTGPIPPNTWVVETETGNVAGPTMQGINYLLGLPATVPVTDLRNPRIGIVPILKAQTWSEVVGKSTVEIVDFAVFYLEGATDGPVGLVEVQGHFQRWAYGVGRSANIGQPLDGLIGARLWE